MGKRLFTGGLQLLCMLLWLWPQVMMAAPAKKKQAQASESLEHEYHTDDHAHDEGHNLFMTNWHLDARIVGSFLIAILCATMVLEWAVHYMESKAEEAVRRLLDRVYKELALLGIISFTLFLIQTFGTQLDDTMYLAFEYAHLLIFFLALAYILQAGLLISAIMPMARRLEKMNTQASTDTGIQNYKSYWGFRVYRAKFIDIHDLPKSFLFDLYHLQSYKSYVTSSLEVAPYCWMSIIVMFIIHVLVSSYSKAASDILLDGRAFLVYGWLILGADLMVYYIVANMHQRILRNLIVEQKAKSMRAEKLKQKGGDLSALSPAPMPRTPVHINRTSSSLKEKRHSIERAHSQLTSLKKKHRHHLSVINLDDSTLVGYGGFTRRQNTLFRGAQDLLLVFHCLYLSAFIITYIGRDIEQFVNNTALAGFLIAVTPLPVLISMLFVGPAMITRYLLVMSLSRVNVEALDDVVEYMVHVEDAFESIAGAMMEEGERVSDMAKIFSMFDTEGHGVLSYAQFKAGLQEHWGLRFTVREFRALTRFLDGDSSGFIDLEEFMKLTHGDEIFEETSDILSLGTGEETKIDISVQNGHDASRVSLYGGH